MSEQATDPTPGRLRAWLGEFKSNWWLYPLAAAILLVLFSDLNGKGAGAVLFSFAVLLFVSCCIGAVITTLYALVGNRLLERFPSKWFEVVLHPTILVIGLAVGSELGIVGLRLFYGPEFDPTVARALIWRFGAGIGIMLMLIGIGISKMRKRAQDQALQAERTKRELLRARLDALQSRTNPHFLFNSLNTIAALAEEDSALAVDAVERLSDLLRYSLESAKLRSVPLEEEIAAIRGYMEVEKLRFGDRLSTAIEVEGNISQAEVPPLLLQPVVENAIKHGVSRRGGGRVSVHVRVGSNAVAVNVEDDGPGKSSAPGTQTGDRDLLQRLELLYGSDARYTAGTGERGGYMVSIEIPLRLPQEGAA